MTHLYNRAHKNYNGKWDIYQVLTGAGGAPFIPGWGDCSNANYYDNNSIPDPADQVKCDKHYENVYEYVLVTVDGSTVTVETKMSSTGDEGTWIVAARAKQIPYTK